MFENAKNRKYFIEFVDVGGSRDFEASRNIFYQDLHGILFVFDVSNRNSYRNVGRWVKEIVDINKVRPIYESFDGLKAWNGKSNGSALRDLPVMLVGNKTDIEFASKENHFLRSYRNFISNFTFDVVENTPKFRRPSSIRPGVNNLFINSFPSLKDFGMESIYVVCLNFVLFLFTKSSTEEDVSTNPKLKSFLELCIERSQKVI